MSLDQLVHSPPDELQTEFSRPDVVLLRWPAQEGLRERLAEQGLPRLLLLSRSCLAPVCADELEDWIREPLHPEELETRTATLRHRARVRALRPRVDESGLVRVGESWIDLPRVQSPVARLLIAELGRVVSAERIQAAYVDAGGSKHPKAVKAMIGRLKRRLAELDLVLTNVRDRGYMLESATPASGSPSLPKTRQTSGSSR
jgi:hypothetical protein